MHTSSASAKNSKARFIWLFAIMLTAGALDARAQNAPPPADLPAAETAPAPSEPPPPALPDSESGAQPATSSTSFVDPCPLPSAELAQAPDDLAKIQSDIDRYTLCMERAQLLQRLNDVAVENQEKLQAANGVPSLDAGASNPGMQLDTLPGFAEQRAQMLGSVNEASVQDSASAPSSSGGNTWYIMKIMGGGSNLSAQLTKEDGTLARVKAGDRLPDGSSIDVVTATTVTITQDNESKELGWRENAAAPAP